MKLGGARRPAPARLDNPSKIDIATAFIAQQKLHGNIVPEKDIAKLIASMGIDKATTDARTAHLAVFRNSSYLRTIAESYIWVFVVKRE